MEDIQLVKFLQFKYKNLHSVPGTHVICIGRMAVAYNFSVLEAKTGSSPRPTGYPTLPNK